MLQQSLSNLLHLYGANQRGICAVLGTPRENISTIPNEKTLIANNTNEDYDFLTTDISLVAGSFLEISKGININIELTEEEQRSPQGKSFLYTVAFIIPNDNFALRGALLRAYDNREWVLIVKERTGAWRVLGSAERGADFSASLKTGSIQTGANQYAMGFTWQSNHRAFYVAAG